MAGAVLRPTGSAITCLAGSFLSWRRMAGRRSSLVMIQKRFGGARGEAGDGLLDHGVLAIERQQLLGAPLAAQRPKARASASGQDYGIEVRVLSHSVGV